MSTGSDVRRARFVVSYRGSAFRGSAISPGVRTVVGDLTETMSTVLRIPVSLTLAGRTDAGVHARGQVISVDLPASTDLGDLVHRINRMCAPEIALRSFEWVDDEFDARFSARWRRYRYHIWNDRVIEPLLTDLTWHVSQPVDLSMLTEMSGSLLGEHDFTSFCRIPDPRPDGSQRSMVRRILNVTWTRRGSSPLIFCEITGTAFCHQMVRSIVGTIVDIGIGRMPEASLGGILEARDRSIAGRVAPAHGLVLWDVGYDDVGEQ